MLSLGLASSREFWLNVSNSVLGIAVLVLLFFLVISLIVDVIKRKRRLPARRVTDGTTCDIASVGVTLSDGGEEREKGHNPRMS